ncbi:MAG TPA: MFS transporter [Bacillota bacterium]
MRRRGSVHDGYRANVGRFYLYRGLVYFYLWLPTWVIYLQRMRQLTLAQIGLIGAVSWCASALAEVPAGVFADRFGRRLSLAVGAFAYAAGTLTVAVAPSFWPILLGDLIWTVGFSFISGADLALVYDSLKADGSEEEYVRVNGRAAAVMFGAQGLASVLGALLATHGLNLPHLAASGMGVVAGLVALTMREPPFERAPAARPGFRTTMREAFGLLVASRSLRACTLYTIVTHVPPFLVTYIFLQPYALEVGVPLAWMGVLVLALRLVSMLGSELSHRVGQRWGEPRFLWTLPLVMALGLAVMAVVGSPRALLLLALVLLASALLRPVISGVLNRQVDGQVRSTVLSFVALGQTVAIAVTQPLFGAVADVWGPSRMMLALAVALGVTVVPALVHWPPFLRDLPASRTPTAP